MKLLRQNGSVWAITNANGLVVAEIHLDSWSQVDEVVLYADSSEQIQLGVLRLAASHVKQYVRHRTTSVFGGLMIAEHANHNLSRESSDHLMNFLMSFSAIPPEINEMDRETIIKTFRSMYIAVTVAVHRQVEDAIEDVINQVGIEGLGYKIISERMAFGNEKAILFAVKKPSNFTFWNSRSKPGGGWDLYIVPSYHPVMNGQESVGMVNGDTDALIRGEAVRSIYCPENAQATDPNKNFGTSWGHVKHPFYATGPTVLFRLSTTKIRSAEGVKELARFIRAALGLDKKYAVASVPL